MRKNRLFTTSMATAILVTTVAVPTMGAQSNEEIRNYYNNGVDASGLQTSVEKRNENEATRTLTTPSTDVSVNATMGNVNKTIDKAYTTYDSYNALNMLNEAEKLMASLGEQYTESMVSNADETRRKAVEKLFGISLTDVDVWDNREGSSTLHGGTYTTVKEMKENAYYAINANKQELIDYALKTKNWVPYRWLEAIQNPSHFELVDGKPEYNKNFYAMMADQLLSNTYHQYSDTTDADKRKALLEKYEKEAKDFAEKYNNAPGYAVYSSELHHLMQKRTSLTVTPYDNDYVNSKWNNQAVRMGKPIDGANPFKTVLDGLNNGSLTGDLNNGYKEKSNSTANVSKERVKSFVDPANKIATVDGTPFVGNEVNELRNNTEFTTSKTATEEEENVIEELQQEKKAGNIFERIILKVKQVTSNE